jgi:hypothetical protein
MYVLLSGCCTFYYLMSCICSIAGELQACIELVRTKIMFTLLMYYMHPVGYVRYTEETQF